MFSVIDNLDNITGWTTSLTGAVIYGLNDHPENIAGYLSASLILNFSETDAYCEKILTADVTNYSEITFHIYSQDNRRNEYRKGTDFKYKIDFGVGKEYYLPAFDSFSSVSIDISAINTVDRIRITALSDDSDYLVISYMIASIDEMPLDIFEGIKTGIEYYISLDSKNNIGTVSCSAGDESIIIDADSDYINRFSVIEITDGINSEYHHIKNSDDSNEYVFSDLYDGDSIVNNFINADVYLFYPVEYGSREDIEIIVPGIAIWGLTSEDVSITNKHNVRRIDTFNGDDTFIERYEGQENSYDILIDCEARQSELLSYLSRKILQLTGIQKIWVNGRRVDIVQAGRPTYIESNDSFKVLPKIQYLVTVIVKEEYKQRNILPLTTTITTTINIQE